MADRLDPGSEGQENRSDDAFRTISEVATDLDVAQHVLRFWETKFPQISPLKRGGGRRYYRPEDVALLTQIRDLLYHEGYTIKGVQKLLRSQSRGRGSILHQSSSAAEMVPAGDGAPSGKGASAGGGDGLSPKVRAELQGLVRELRDLRTLIDRAVG